MIDLINNIEQLCRRHNSPAVAPGTHALAAKIMRMIEAELGPADCLPRTPPRTRMEGRTEADGQEKKSRDA